MVLPLGPHKIVVRFESLFIKQKEDQKRMNYSQFHHCHLSPSERTKHQYYATYSNELKREPRLRLYRNIDQLPSSFHTFIVDLTPVE
jgi:hypothetical protein